MWSYSFCALATSTDNFSTSSCIAEFSGALDLRNEEQYDKTYRHNRENEFIQKYRCHFVMCEYVPLQHWFLIWVGSSPRGSVSQFQGFGSFVCMNIDVMLCFASLCINTVYICFAFEAKRHILFFQLRKGLRDSVPPKRVRATELKP